MLFSVWRAIYKSRIYKSRPRGQIWPLEFDTCDIEYYYTLCVILLHFKNLCFQACHKVFIYFNLMRWVWLQEIPHFKGQHWL